MTEILNMLNKLTADELDSVIMRASIMLEKKRKEEAEAAIREQERLRLERIEQEKKRLEEIAELQRKLQELQNQKIVIPEEPGKAKGDGFVMYDVRKPIDDAPKAAEQKPQSPAMVACPHCHLMNVASSRYCANCGQSMTVKAQPAPAAQPQTKPAKVFCPHCRSLNEADSVFCANCGQKMTVKQAAPQPAHAPQPAPAPAARPQASAGQVRYADESMKKWEMLPGEKSVSTTKDIIFLQPDSINKKCAYHMEVTDKRILFTRESAGAKNATMVARMGGGLVGSLIAEGVKAASGAGPKPWLEIPLTAVSSCGIQNKKEFFIVADQTYVLKNRGFDRFLPDLVAKAKQ